MKILNIREFKQKQYEEFSKRRTSQLTRFLNKSIDFVTYYHVNTNTTTTAINNHNVDSYIGKDSPVRYSKIESLPVFGFPVITETNDYDETEGGFNVDNFEGTITILPDIINPVEGDRFVLNAYSTLQFFKVIKVDNIELRSKPYYNVTFTGDIPEYLDQLNRQVTEEYIAIFDNYGTTDKVVISKAEYDTFERYKDIYKEMYEYYINKFFNKNLTIFTAKFFMIFKEDNVNYTDQFVSKFMDTNRIILSDRLLRDTLMMDFNHMDSKDDYSNYKKSIYYMIENRNEEKLIPANYIECKLLNSSFSQIVGYTSDQYFCGNKLSENEPNVNNYFIEYDGFYEVYNKLKNSDYFNSGDGRSRSIAAIVNYVRGQILNPEYFKNIIDNMSDMDDYFLIPVVMYIIRAYMDGITKKVKQV